MNHIPVAVEVKIPRRRGSVNIQWSVNRATITRQNGEQTTYNESQGRIIKELTTCDQGLIASELAARLGMTHAGVLFLLKPLLKDGLVQRGTLRGGGVLYYTDFEIKEKPSEELNKIIAKIEQEKGGRKITTFSLKELRDATKDLPSDKRRSILNLLIEGVLKA